MASCCSFCTKDQSAVATLVAGPGVCICNECVGLCALIINDKPGAVPQVPAWEQTDDLALVLDTIPKIAAAGAQVEASLTAWVRRARALGATWAAIGAALQMTRQSAWERFSGEE